MEDLNNFCDLIYMPDDIVEIRCFHPDRDSGKRPIQFWWTAAEIPSRRNELLEFNEKGYGIYAGVMPRTRKGSGKDTDCLPSKVVWADFDGEGNDDPRVPFARVRKAGFPDPSVVVESGHGTHFYWIMDARVKPEEIKPVVGGIADLFGGDPSVKNASRVMRLPGFKNTKYDDGKEALLRLI
jgi:hypothetical protein